jgi:hypothetical protein
MRRTAGLVLIAGGLVSLALDALGAPESLLRFGYHHLLSGLDVPRDPSPAAEDIVRYFASFAAIVELLAGAVLVGLSFRSGEQPRRQRSWSPAEMFGSSWRRCCRLRRRGGRTS